MLRYAQDNVRIPRITDVMKAVAFGYLYTNRIQNLGGQMEYHPELGAVAHYTDEEGLTIHTVDEFLELVNTTWVKFITTGIEHYEALLLVEEFREFFDMSDSDFPRTTQEARVFLIKEFTGA